MPNNFGIQIRNLGAMATAWARGLQQQLYDAPGATIGGVKPSDWPSAMQPVRPFGAPDAEPLAIRLIQAMNQVFTPRPDATYSAADLQKLAKYPLADLCINGVCDAIGDANWSIDPKPLPGETKADRAARSKGDTNILAIQKFFDYPNKSERQNWSEWTRPLIRQMLTIDAASILIRKNRKGTIAEIPVIPGDTIARYVDNGGWTPKPPSPAYAQLWEGMPRLNLTTDQLLYKPRNIVWGQTQSSQLYGCSPIESLAPEIEVGAQRLAFVDAFYRTGNLPNALQVIPADAPPDRVKRAFELLDSELSGNLGRRRGIRSIQGFSPEGKDQIVFPPQPILSDAYDDLHIHKICFGLFTSPQRLIRMMTRATAQENQEAAEEEGLWPVRSWIRGLINYLIEIMMGYEGYEFTFKPEAESDKLKQAQTLTTYTDAGVMEIEEAREVLELDPAKEKNAARLGKFGANGWISLDTEAPPPGAPPVTGADGKPPIPRGSRTPPETVNAPELNDDGKKILKLVLAPARRTY